MDGLWEFYQENGQLEFRSNYKDGKWDGFIEFFNEDGLFWFKNCYKNGEEINMSYCYKRFYENLQFRSKGNVKNDKKEGLWEYFDENGDTLYSEFWDNGVFIKQLPEQTEVEIWDVEIQFRGKDADTVSIPIANIGELTIEPKYKNSSTSNELTVTFEVSAIGHKMNEKNLPWKHLKQLM